MYSYSLEYVNCDHGVPQTSSTLHAGVVYGYSAVEEPLHDSTSTIQYLQLSMTFISLQESAQNAGATGPDLCSYPLIERVLRNCVLQSGLFIALMTVYKSEQREVDLRRVLALC